MIKGSHKRTAAHPVHPIFVDRWSPRAFSGEPVSEDELNTLFEAARWAPSSGNVQPWRILYARRETAHWSTFYNLLKDGNKLWAERASALLVLASDTVMESRSGKEPRANDWHSFDAGAAWMNIALQGSLMGLGIRGVAGFEREAARVALKVPERFHLDVMIAVGKPGSVEHLNDSLRERETPSDRRPLSETVREGEFSF